MSEASTAETPSRRTLNILIVDDSATMRAVLRRVIQLTEMPVEHIYEARNGREPSHS